MPRVIVVEDNLFLRPRIESSLRSAGHDVAFAPGLESFRRVEGAPDAVLINLDSASFSWKEVVEEARGRFGPELPIIGYGPHVDSALIDSARTGGCTEAVPNGLVARTAARVVGNHLDARSS